LLNIISGSLSTGAPPPSLTSYESIATVTVGSGGAADVTFSSIPSTYTHLQIRWIARIAGDNDSGGQGMAIQTNGDTSGYALHALYGDGATAAALGSINQAEMIVWRLTTPTQTSGVFGAGITDILDYANVNKYKTLRNLGGFDNNGAGIIALNSSLTQSTTAISSIKLYRSGGSNFVQYTQFALYGIKGV
jgi:hypothetical protein